MWLHKWTLYDLLCPALQYPFSDFTDMLQRLINCRIIIYYYFTGSTWFRPELTLVKVVKMSLMKIIKTSKVSTKIRLKLMP